MKIIVEIWYHDHRIDAYQVDLKREASQIPLLKVHLAATLPHENTSCRVHPKAT